MSTKNLTKGICRLCSADGYHRDVTKQYRCKGQAEVYSDMLMECFNLTIQTHPNAYCLICLHCVERLRDACDFRELVYRAASLLRDPLQKTGDGEFVHVSGLTMKDPVIVKTEAIKMEVMDDDVLYYDEEESNDFGHGDASPASDTDQPLAWPEAEQPGPDPGADWAPGSDSGPGLDPAADWSPGPDQGPGPDLGTGADWGPGWDSGPEWERVPGEAELLARHPAPPRLPRAPSGRFMEYCRQLRGKVITSEDIARMLAGGGAQAILARPPDEDFGSEKRALITNITNVIRHSNVTPFRSKTSQGFRCFYCRKPLKTLSEIRQHNATEHVDADFAKSLWKYGAEAIIVNVDVTDLACTDCGAAQPSLAELKRHLEQRHKVQFTSKYTDRIVPFSIAGSQYECRVCSCRYETFGSIERHMNTHLRNYVCKVCGNGFVTKYRLKVHLKSLHDNGTWTCTVCAKVFASYQKRKTHMDAVHRMVKRFRCPKCPERFTEYFARQKHLVDSHGAEPIKYKCNVCDKEYDRRYALSRHLKKDHLKEKNHQCEECGYKCFTSNELKMHVIKHDGARVHECPVCRKAYARKKTLTEHLKIHNNDRRHVYSACGQAFIQKCSLKGHVKTHHPELAAGD